MAPKRARIVAVKEVTQIGDPFVTFIDIQEHQERIQRLIGLCILAGHTLDWTSVQTLGVKDEIRRLLHTPQYSQIFIITEPTYKELVCEFLRIL